MAIVIKEIILSDTLENFMEKVNFNFDQLLLAGGGPPGPVGPSGLPGPAGPKGDPGNKWYVGCTGTSSAIGVTLYQGDLFLQNECGASGASYGDIYEWDDLLNTFSNTGLNIIGPQGPAGPAGANLFGGIFPGQTSGSVFRAFGEAAPGPTTNYYLLKGDTDYIGLSYGTGPTDFVGGQTSTYSRETLWLGGIHGAQIMTDEIPLSRMPKIFISPRTLFPSNPTAPDYQGKAGSGIMLGRETSSFGIQSGAKPNNWSNIFVDDLMNLRITNYTDFIPAAATEPSAINLESLNAIRLISGGFGPLPSTASAFSFQQGKTTPNLFQSIDFNVIGGTPNLYDYGGHIFKQTSSESRFQVDIDEQSIIRLSGGGSSLAVDTSREKPSLHLSNQTGSGLASSSNYTILIETESASNVDDGWEGAVQAAFIKKGYTPLSGGDAGYIGLGNTPYDTSSADRSFLTYLNIVNDNTNSAKGIHIGLMTSADITWQSGLEESLDIVGRLRMRNSATGASGTIMVDSDGTGTGQWTDPLSIGAWITDPDCPSDNRIVVNETTQWATTYNRTASNYSRFDAAIDAGTVSTLDSSNSFADLFFMNYTKDPLLTNTNDYSISLNFQDDGSLGQLAFMSYDWDNNPACSYNPETGRGNIGNVAGTYDHYGRWVLNGNTPGNISTINTSDNVALKIVGRSDINIDGFEQTTGSITLQTIDVTPTADIGGYQYPRIILSNNTDHSEIAYGGIGDPGGWNDQISLEFLKTEGSQASGPSNIRFVGVRKVNTTQGEGRFNGIDDGKTGTGVGSSAGAHAVLFSDQPGATNQWGESGKSPNGFSVNGYELFVDKLRMYWRTSSYNGNNFINDNYNANQLYRSRVIDLAQWGDNDGPWSVSGNNSRNVKQFRFNGSISKDPIPSTESPLRYDAARNCLRVDGFLRNGAPAAPAFAPISGQNVVNWIGPDAEVKFAPINVNFTQENNANGMGIISFNIPMGIIFEQQSQPKQFDSSSTLVGNHADGAPIYSYGSCGYGSSTNARTAMNDNGLELIPSDPHRSSVKLQTVRVKLPNDAVKGIAMFDATNDYGRKLSLEDGQTDQGVTLGGGKRQFNTLQTQWFSGTCEPIQHNRTGSLGYDDYTDSSTDASTIWKDYWPGGWGAGSWYDTADGAEADFNNESKWIEAFTDGADPTSSWRSPVLNHTSLMGEFGLYPDFAADYSRKHQMQTFHWRIVQEKTSGTLQTGAVDLPVSHTYLEFNIIPGNARSQGFSEGTGQFEGIEYNQMYHSLPNTLPTSPPPLYIEHTSTADKYNNFGMPISTPVIFQQYTNGANGVLNACALIADTKRTTAFYNSHGFAFNGSAVINFSTEKNPAVTSTGDFDPDPGTGGGGGPLD